MLGKEKRYKTEMFFNFVMIRGNGTKKERTNDRGTYVGDV